MGDIADGFLDGTFCEFCGVYLEDGSPGYPRHCLGCEPDVEEPRMSREEWVDRYYDDEMKERGFQ